MPRCRTRNADYAAYLYERLQRQGYLLRDVPAAGQPGPQSLRRLHGGARRRRRHGDRRHPQLLGRAGGRAARASIPSPATASSACRWCWRAAAPCWSPTPRSPKCRTREELADIAVEAAGVARRLGYEPRVALLAFSTFGHPPGERSAQVQRGGAACSTSSRVDFEYDGEMAADVALNPEAAGGLSVLPPDRPGQCADHAGVPLGVDLDQAAAGAGRRDRDRPAAGRARPAGADRAARRQGHASSSTWRRSRRSM